MERLIVSDDPVKEETVDINGKLSSIEQKRRNFRQDELICTKPPKLMVNGNLLLDDDDGRAVTQQILREDEKKCDVQTCSSKYATTTDPSSVSLTPLDSKLLCKLCDKCYEDPRILPCLHTFCARCINKLKAYIPTNDSRSSKQKSKYKENALDSSSSSSSSLSPSSSSSSSSSSILTVESKIKKIILCPVCDTEFDVPCDVENYLPINYILQRQVLTWSTKNELSTSRRVQCDLCSCDLPVTNKCEDCDCALCVFCAEAHKRQRKTCAHHVVKMTEKSRNEDSLKTSTSLTCRKHPNEELNLFCEECLVTLCCSCADTNHGSHSCRFAADVSNHQISHLQDVMAEVKPYAENIKIWMDNLGSVSESFDVRVTRVTQEVNQFIDAYIQMLQVHRQNLLSEIKKVHLAKEQDLALQRIQFEQTLEDLQSSFAFSNELVEYGSDIEILSLLKVVLQRFQDLEKIQNKSSKREETGIMFNKTEKLNVNGFSILGTISSRNPPLARFIVKGDGLLTARQGQWAEIFVTCQDLDGNSMVIVEDDIKALLVAKDQSGRCIPLQITNYRNGLYRFSFCPGYSGIFLLHIECFGKPIQGSPFVIPIKEKWRSHVGVYHCCSFCSSGGSKEAQCACDGSMPGGFKGCGHGHKDYPGRKHWSCCGKIIENSECSRPLSKLYTFTI